MREQIWQKRPGDKPNEFIVSGNGRDIVTVVGINEDEARHVATRIAEGMNSPAPHRAGALHDALYLARQWLLDVRSSIDDPNERVDFDDAMDRINAALKLNVTDAA